MTDVVRKADLFLALGYAPPHDPLERALEDGGLSRPDKSNIARSKVDAVRELLAERFVPVCSRGDCRRDILADADDRMVVPASSPDECAICGGSANARAVDQMIAALDAAGVRRLCVVGGAPNTRTEFERLVAGRCELRLVDGAQGRTAKQASADLAWADRVALWGGTILDHKVSRLYRGPKVIQLARRGIQELARQVARSVRETVAG